MSHVPPAGWPVVVPRASVGGGVTCGLLVTASTLCPGVEVAASVDPVGVADGVGVGVGAGVGVLKWQLFAAVHGGDVGGGLVITTASAPQLELALLLLPSPL